MRLAIMSVAHLHADGYINNLRAVPDVEFLGIADDDLARGQAFAEQHCTRLYESYDALLADKPDGVLVCSENARHLPLVLQAAEAGVHILCEKPLATTVEDCRTMIDACERAGVKLMTAFPMRFSPPVIEAKRVVDSGALGRIYGCNTTNQGSCPKDSRAWFVDKELAGGGAVMDHTVHLTDLLRWYLNSEVVEVFAETNAILYADATDEVETGGLISLLFDNGVFATIDCSWSKPKYYPTWGGLAMEIVGEGGFTTVDAFRQKITVYSHDRGRPVYKPWGSDADQGLINEFVASIREDRVPSITGYDGLKATEVVVAAYRSAETGQVVRLPLE
ncbi:MAG: Gfo/Idh/MocA family oxidoreductase [Chloroflexota bacterium]|nr:MAG: gfo/Idh/MocA family oxidoreductase [Chloroflexota bacterium]